MRLYLCRHGEAEPFAASDAERSLTRQGERETQLLWSRLVQAGVQPKRIIASPYKRALQTASLVAASCALETPAINPLLGPDTPPAQVLDWLQGEDIDELLLVTHMPLIALLTGMLAGEEGERLAFATGTVVALELEVAARGVARLLWLRAPGEAF